METAGYIASIFIGLVLGLIGSGGTILAIPILAYLFKIDTVLATSYSLFIAGTTSLIGAASYLRDGIIDIKMAMLFGIPSIAAVFFTRANILPAIPDHIVQIGNYTLTKGLFLMLFFGVLMILASYSMIKGKKKSTENENTTHKTNYPFTFILGILVGVSTGLVGAGGGFLIIPTLVILNKLPMKEAVGTSLLIISAKSLIGFWGGEIAAIDWFFLLKIIGLAIVGILIGLAISKKINGKKLKPAFGWFVLIIGVYIILKETLLS